MKYKKLEDESSFNATTKIWSGTPLKRFYDRDCSIGQILFEEMRRNPKRICQISDTENTTLTNEQVLLQAIRIANCFKSYGIQQSDIVGICSRNTTYVLAVLLGCFFHGTPYHAVNINHDWETMKSLWSISKPKIIFCNVQEYDKLKAVTKDWNVKLITLKEQLEDVTFIEELLQPTEEEIGFEPTVLQNGTQQILTILCSSGSTGLPKAVTISNSTRMYKILDFLTAQDICYCPSTNDWISHTFVMLSCLVYGCTMVISEKAFSPENYVYLVQKYKITITVQSSRNLCSVAHSPLIKAEHLDTVKYCCYGGSKCTIQTQEAMQTHLRNGIIIYMYGLTEVGALVARNLNFSYKPGSVGHLQSGFEAKILNELGDQLLPEQVGELCIHSSAHWNGYYNNPIATAAFYDKDGWFHTGDLGYFDKDNFLYIVDRKKDTLKYQGRQYCPSEIEQVIAEMSNVEDVCVFGIFNERVGDAAAAAVEKKSGTDLTAEQIVEYVRSHIESTHKHLHGGAFIVEELPKTANGKIHREALKTMFACYADNI